MGKSFGSVFHESTHDLANINSIQVNLNTNWQEILSTITVTTTEVPEITPFNDIKQRIITEFTNKLPNDIKDDVKRLTVPSRLEPRPVNWTIFNDYTNYQRSWNRTNNIKNFKDWSQDVKNRDKNYNNEIRPFIDGEKKRIRIKKSIEKINQYINSANQNYNSDTEKRKKVVAYVARFKVRAEILKLEEVMKGSLNMKEGEIDEEEIKRREDQLKRMKELEDDLEERMNEWKINFDNDMLEKGNILDDELDDYGNKLGGELDNFRDELNKCYKSNSACKLRKSNKFLVHLKDGEKLKNVMAPVLSPEQKDPWIPGATVDYSLKFKQMKEAREQREKERQDKLTSINEWFERKKKEVNEWAEATIESEHEIFKAKQDSIDQETIDEKKVIEARTDINDEDKEEEINKLRKIIETKIDDIEYVYKSAVNKINEERNRLIRSGELKRNEMIREAM
jgi:hypothetical protein